LSTATLAQAPCAPVKDGAAMLAEIEQRLVAERLHVDARNGEWHLGARAGLARALDIIREAQS
jgi:hypothetical protein